VASKYLNINYIKSQLDKDKDKDKDDKNQTTSNNEQQANGKTITEQNSEPKPTTPQNVKVYSNDQLTDELNNIKEKYKYGDYVDAPESLGLEKVEVPEKSEEELVTLAKNSLEQNYNTQKNNTTTSFEKQIEDIINSKKSLTDSASKQTTEINEIYDRSVAQTEEQALKRGLARSSIVINQLSTIEGDRANQLATILNTLQSSLDINQSKISQLEKQKDQALSELDVEYALELQDQIEKTTQEYQKQRQEAIDFNNSIAKLEAEYKLDLDKQKQAKQKQTIEMNEKYGVNHTQNIIAQKQFEFLKNYYDTLEPSFALDQFLTSSSLKSILGNNYSTLYQYLSKRLQKSQND